MSDMALALVGFTVCLAIAYAAAVSAVAWVQAGTLRITRKKLREANKERRQAVRELAAEVGRNAELRELLDASEVARLRDPAAPMSPYDIVPELGEEW